MLKNHGGPSAARTPLGLFLARWINSAASWAFSLSSPLGFLPGVRGLHLYGYLRWSGGGGGSIEVSSESDAFIQTPVAYPAEFTDRVSGRRVAMAVDHVRLAGALAEIVADPSCTTEFPKRLCRACDAALPVDGVGVSLMLHDQPDRRVLLGASDERGARIEELQFGLGEGPCVSAFVGGRPVLVPDLEASEAFAQWPMFTPEAMRAGIGAVFAFPLQIGMIAIGVLDCYRARAGPLTEMAEALAVTDAVTIALLNAQALGGDSANGTVDLFDVSWRNHAVVHQATGALSVELGISLAEALVRLRAHAFRHSRPLDAVADDVLAGRLHLTL
jgi:hypothetical protein